MIDRCNETITAQQYQQRQIEQNRNQIFRWIRSRKVTRLRRCFTIDYRHTPRILISDITSSTVNEMQLHTRARYFLLRRKLHPTK